MTVHTSTAQHFTNLQVLVELRALTATEHVTVQRLRYLARAILHAPPQLWALIQLVSSYGNSWIHEVVGDLEWLFGLTKYNSTLPAPEFGCLGVWFDWIASHPAPWKKRIGGRCNCG